MTATDDYDSTLESLAALADPFESALTDGRHLYTTDADGHVTYDPLVIQCLDAVDRLDLADDEIDSAVEDMNLEDPDDLDDYLATGDLGELFLDNTLALLTLVTHDKGKLPTRLDNSAVLGLLRNIAEAVEDLHG
ncbi:hypothetical protein [Bifidobacterium vansinderenii]|uniref:Uncharacterized protein n=1 Tax=Bifidobacterium vansinderenii TaxID=1984871 RepID=A0A229W0A5_9BIFI|nr:hypothetical protein [Bifidobacterium vansinderenii]OXN01256.1 hypothetical protein Tam10B_0256 [Bifidobacterium vansinderenii]